MENTIHHSQWGFKNQESNRKKKKSDSYIGNQNIDIGGLQVSNHSNSRKTESEEGIGSKIFNLAQRRFIYHRSGISERERQICDSVTSNQRNRKDLERENLANSEYGLSHFVHGPDELVISS